MHPNPTHTHERDNAGTEPLTDIVLTKRPRRLLRRIITIGVASLVAVVTLVAALGVVFISGVVPLSGFESRIAAALYEKLGNSWSITIQHAEISRNEGRSFLLVRDVAFHHAGGTQFRAPEALLGYEPLQLLFGELRLNSIELRGLNVRVGLDLDGSVRFDAGAEPVKVPARIDPAAQSDVSTQFLGAALATIDSLIDDSSPFARLDNAALSRARVTFVDPEGRERIGLDNISMRLNRTGERKSRIVLLAGDREAERRVVVDVSSGDEGQKKIDVTLKDILFGEALTYGHGFKHLDVQGLPLTGTIKISGQTAETSSVAVNLQFGSGNLHVHGADMAALSIDSARLDAASGDGLKSLVIPVIDISSPNGRLGGRISAQVEPAGVWSVDGQLSGHIAGIGKDPPIAITTLDFKATASPADIKLTQFTLQGPTIAASGSSHWTRTAHGYYQALTLQTDRSQARSIVALWPSFIAPKTRAAIAERLESGVVENLTLNSALTSEMRHALITNFTGLPDSALNIGFQAADIRFQPAPGLPTLAQVNLKAQVTGKTFAAQISSAKAVLGEGRTIALSDGALTIADTFPDRPIARITARATGGADALLAFLASPDLRDVMPIGATPEQLKGAMDLKIGLTLPLGPKPKPSEVVVEASGTLSGLSSDTLLGGEKLEGASFNVSYEKNSLVLRGEGRVGGDKSQIDVRQPSRGNAEATVTMVLDQAARQRRGFGFDGQVTGPITLKITKALGGKTDTNPRVEVDLSRAGIEGLLPGWSKPVGRPARMTFMLQDDGSGYDFDDFMLDASPVLAKGKISLDKQNALDSANLSTFRLSPGDDLKVDAKQEGNVLKLTIRGAVADARPFLKDLNGSGGGARSDQQKKTDYDLDLAVPILTGFNAEAIGNASLKLSKRGKEIRALAFDGRIGRNAINARMASRGTDGGLITITAADGGALMRYLDIYTRAYGGDLIMTMKSGSDRQSGDVLLRDFSVRNEPALRRVAAAQSGGGENTGPAPSRLNVEQVDFTKLRAGFSRNAARVDIRDAVIWGKELGFTLQGNIDYARNRIDIAGTFIPGYAFNNAFSQVPIVGQILGGGQNEGLFAVNFRIGGAANAPSMTVNALSALAPGILRRFVDPFGGTPSGTGALPGASPGPGVQR